MQNLATAKWLALLTLAALPASSRAAWLGFRNDLAVPIQVQVIPVVNGRVAAPARVSLLYPGEVSQEFLLQPGTRQIRIFSPRRPTRPLCQATIICAGDLNYSIRLDMNGGVFLTPIPPPTRPPATPARPGRSTTMK